MSAMASQITGVSIVCLAVASGTDQRKNQNSMSLAFVWGMFPFDDVIIFYNVTDRPEELSATLLFDGEVDIVNEDWW